jgi:hypothetical protein
MSRKSHAPPIRGVSVGDARDLLLRLEGVSAGRSYGQPSFLLAAKFFARFRDEETVLVLQLGSIDDRDVLMHLDPAAFFFTDHYRDYPAVLIRLAEVPPGLLADVILQAWRDVAAKRMAPAPKTRRRTAGRAAK